MSIINLMLKANSYNVYIEQGLLQGIGKLISEWYKGERITIITDSSVDKLHGNALTASLSRYAYYVSKIVVDPGEKSKSIETLSYIYNNLAQQGITRNNLIIAFGGGVIGDLAGFAAATYMRGIPYVQVPTTVMSQLDSSIGGKTAINLEAGKNLAGCFYQPKAVYIDTDILQTLPDKLFSEGLAEAIKYGAIKDTEFFNRLLGMNSIQDTRAHINDIIFNCAVIKCDIVGKDEYDTGERMLLNFGHTFGHGIERYYNFEKYSHGEAVGLGMIIITRGSEAMGITKAGTADAIKEALAKFGLPYTYSGISKEKLLQFVKMDKKSEDNSIKLILLKKPGHAFVDRILKDDLINFLQ